MTSGQRNCYLAIRECLQSYQWDDLIFALATEVEDSAASTTDKYKKRVLRRLGAALDRTIVDLQAVDTAAK